MRQSGLIVRQKQHVVRIANMRNKRDVPSGYPSNQSARALVLRNVDILDPKPHVGLELFECPLEDVKLPPDEGIVRYGGRRGRQLCKNDHAERRSAETHPEQKSLTQPL